MSRLRGTPQAGVPRRDRGVREEPCTWSSGRRNPPRTGQQLLELGDLPNAELHIRQAEERSSHNPYVVDLRCTIALRLGDLETAGARSLFLNVSIRAASPTTAARPSNKHGVAPEAALEFAESANRKMRTPHSR